MEIIIYKINYVFYVKIKSKSFVLEYHYDFKKFAY